MQASLIIMSVQSIIWNRSLPHFSQFHTDIFALTLRNTEFDKTNVHYIFAYTSFNTPRPFLGGNK